MSTIEVTGNYTDDSGIDIVLQHSNSVPAELYGGSGDNVIVAASGPVITDASLGNNTRANAIAIDDFAKWTTGFSPLVGDPAVPHTLIAGTGWNQQDYFAVSLVAGATITLDMDFASAGFDSVLKLLDASGTVLATNDDANTALGGLGSVPMPGSFTSHDSWLSYTVASAGTYYIQVGAIAGFAVGGVPTGESYLLNVSATGHVASGPADLQTAAQIWGEGGNDTLVGTTAGDGLYGGAGNDMLYGGAGDDVLAGDDGIAGDDLLDGGAGADTADYSLAGSGVTVSLEIEGPQATGGAGTDTLTAIENLKGSAFGDVLTGDGNGNVLTGGAGNDVVDGRGGDDIVVAGHGVDTANGGDDFDYDTIRFGGTDGWFIDAGAGHAYVNAAGLTGNVTSFSDFEKILGSDFSDVIVAAAEFDIYAGGGTDVIYGALGMGVIDGGAGGDLLDISAVGSAGQAFTFNLTTGASSVATLLVSIDDLTTGATNDTVTGDDSVNRLATGGGSDTIYALGGNDVIDGGAGNDLILGGTGDDSIEGGAGFDTASYEDATGGVEVSLALTGPQATGWGSDTLSGIEALTGSGFDDLLSGNAAANTLSGGAGNDWLDGGAGADKLIGGVGNDRYIVDNTGDRAIENDGEGLDGVESSVSYSLAGQFIEMLLLTGTADISGSGNALSNLLVGNSGANRLNGGAGADMMQGGKGNDHYVVDDIGDVVIENAGEGLDTVESTVDYTLGVSLEALKLLGSTSISGTGNALANVIIGNSGANAIDGRGGADTMQGGKGDDVYWVDDAGDVVLEADGEGSDTINASVSYSLAGQYVEVLNLAAPGAVNGTGNSLNNRIIGNDGANTLNGGAGNDRLDGGAGNDKLIGGLGNDVFVVDSAGDVVVEKDGEGTDTVEASISYSLAGQYIEILKLVGVADLNGTGNGLANTLYGNYGNNILNGGGGADTMAGGTGDDRYIVDNAGDKIVELNGEGNDTVEASVSFSLAGQYAETLILTGTAAINGTGSGQANTLIGNGAANVLNAGAGNDELHGGLGADTLIGGAGNDYFWFDSTLGAANVDKIGDFSSVDDTIVLGGMTFAALAGGSVSDDAFFLGTAAHDADDRIVYDQATGNLWYDADGNGAGNAVLFAQLTNHAALTAADFLVL